MNVPAPLISRQLAAPLIVLTAIGLAGAEMLGSLWLGGAKRAEHAHPCDMTGLLILLGVLLAAIGGPTLALASHLLATARWGLATTVLAAAVIVPALLGATLGAGGALLGAIPPALMVAAVSPVLLLAARAGRRVDLEAHDELLAGGAAWLAAGQLLACSVYGPCLGATVAGVVIGAGASTLAVARIVHRRRWAARVVRGNVPGLRAARSDAPAPSLPRLFRGRDAQGWLVVERVAERVADPYRALPEAPAAAIALVPAPTT